MSNLRVGAIDSVNGNNAIAVAADGKSTFSSTPVGVGMTYIDSVTVPIGSSGGTALKIDGCFSATYDYYKVFYNVFINDTGATVFIARTGNGGTLYTSGSARGVNEYSQVNTSGGYGKQFYYSSKRYHQLMGSLDGSATTDTYFNGEMLIMNPYSTTTPTNFTYNGMMVYGSNQSEASKWAERGGSIEDWGDVARSTDLMLGALAGGTSGQDITTTTMKAVYGNFTIFGVKS